MNQLLIAGILLMANGAGAEEKGEAIFAGGCFWCEETAFEGVPGVKAVISGYTGGSRRNPAYEEVSAGTTGHAESVKVVYDPAKITYVQLLGIFWHSVDPLSGGGQFCDRGNQYRSAIFYLDEGQRKAAETSKKIIEKQLKDTVVTEITRAGEFWPAEEYHQDFFKKNPLRYSTYRAGCGRDRRLRELWGDSAVVAH
jgi:peptide-methionine (S)-S-oxide reductase